MENKSELYGVEYLVYKKIETLINSNEANWDETSKTYWTSKVNKAIIELGESLNFTIYCSEIGDINNSEWIYDIIWSKDDVDEYGKKNWRKFKGLGLICEVEWGWGDRILEDFTKLTVGDADYRVMVVNHDENYPNHFEEIKNLCVDATKYRFNNYKYLLISIPWHDPRNLEYFNWIH